MDGSPLTRSRKRVGSKSAAGTFNAVRINRIIKRRLQDDDGNVIGDVNAAVAVNVGEPGGSETHVHSHSRIVQSTRSTRARKPTRPEPPAAADDPKEDA
jgi:hypothetical protein